MTRWALAAILSTVAFAAGIASADAIAEPSCEHGWSARYAGHSAYCAPHVCTSDSECGGGSCVEVARCFRTQPMDTGMAVLPPGASIPTYEAPIDTLCGPDGSCAAGSHCTHERECTEPQHSGLCSVAAPARTAFPLVPAVCAFSVVAARCWRRRRPTTW